MGDKYVVVNDDTEKSSLVASCETLFCTHDPIEFLNPPWHNKNHRLAF